MDQDMYSRLLKTEPAKKTPQKGLAETMPAIEIGENGRRVLEKRYLKRDAEGKTLETIEEMFWRVAANIAEGDRKFDKDADVEAVAREFGAPKTLLGIDALVEGQIVGTDLSEKDILALLTPHHMAKLVLSPIGAQGFVLGRGNLQLSPQALRRIGAGNMIVIATPAKLASTPVLHVDTGDAALDAKLAAPGYLPVIIGDRRMRLVKVAA